MKLGNHTRETFYTVHHIWAKLLERNKNERIALTLWRNVNNSTNDNISLQLAPYKIKRV